MKLGFVQQSQDSCLVMTDTSGSYTMLGRKIQTLLEVSQEAKRPLLVATVILVFLSIFTKSQASSPFEALNSAQLSKSQMDVRPSVQKSLRTMAFSKCRGIGPHLAARGKSHEVSRVAAGTWCIFSCYGGDGHLKLGFVQRS